MVEATNKSLAIDDTKQFEEPTDVDSFRARLGDWVRGELVWYAGSFTFHLLAIATFLLFGSFAMNRVVSDAPTFSEVQKEPPEETPTLDPNIDITPPQDEPPPAPELLPSSPTFTDDLENNSASELFQPSAGGETGGDAHAANPGKTIDFGLGPKPSGSPGAGLGSIGDGIGNVRHRRSRNSDVTRVGEAAVTGALVWLARHQLSDGSWSLQNYVDRCRDRTCTGPGTAVADPAATAMGLLPFLAAGYTHKTRGPYRATVNRGLAWLLKNQQPDGDLAKGVSHKMYAHALATIALCEAYGLTGDKQVGIAAQRAIDYIIAAQNKTDGGWRYAPGDPGDTSVVGWQLMALKSAQMAGLSVGGSSFADTSKYLDLVAQKEGSQYAYQPGGAPVNTMSAVGLLCRQYLGANRENPMLVRGTKYLLENPPDASFSNIYYWYYATQVMHNMNGYEWDTWNRKMRKILIHSQNTEVGTCANGSWDPAADHWGQSGGRVMMTSLCALTLEIYYRYLPLFKAEAGGGPAAPAPLEQKHEGNVKPKPG